MKYEAVFYVADLKENNFLQSCGLKPDFKWFIQTISISFKTTAKVDGDYFLDVIERSKNDGDRWLPAIQFGSRIFADPGVKVLSNGESEFFL